MIGSVCFPLRPAERPGTDNSRRDLAGQRLPDFPQHLWPAHCLCDTPVSKTWGEYIYLLGPISGKMNFFFRIALDYQTWRPSESFLLQLVPGKTVIIKNPFFTFTSVSHFSSLKALPTCRWEGLAWPLRNWGMWTTWPTSVWFLLLTRKMRKWYLPQ